MNALRSTAAKIRKKVQVKAAQAFSTRERAGKPRKKSATKRAWGRKASPRKDVAKGVQSMVYTRKVGLKVYVYEGNNYDTRVMHKNRRGLMKPVLLWASAGTKPRHTKGGFFRQGGHNRGAMPQKNFLKQAAAEVDPLVASEFADILTESTKKIAVKYGAKLS